MSEHDRKSIKVVNKAGPFGFMFFLAYIGAVIYFIQQTDGGFWVVVLAFLKAIVWPVFVMYHVLQTLGV